MHKIKDLTDYQKVLLFDRAVALGKVRQSDINETFAEFEAQKKALAEQLNRLVAATGAGIGSADVPMPTKAGLKTPTARKRGRKKSAPRKKASKASKVAAKKAVAAQLKSRKLQGRYLALVRQFPSAEVRKDWGEYAKEHGREKAVEEMAAALAK